MGASVPIGLQIRRARLAAGMTQHDLARRAKVSQPLVSYYERVPGADGPGLAQIVEVLGLDHQASHARTTAAEPPRDDSWLTRFRQRLLATLGQSSLRISVVDRPASTTSGDVAFSLDLESHTLVAVLDGLGRGSEACTMSLLECAAIVGAHACRRGVLWPDELLAELRSLPGHFGVKTFASAFLAVFDRKHQELVWAKDRFPAPFLRRDRKVVLLSGTQTGAIESGRVDLGTDWLLLVGTDGVADAPTRRDHPFWESRELKQLVINAPTTAALVNRLESQLRSAADDDGLALAISRGDLWSA